MKKVIYMILALVVLIIGFFTLNAFIYQEKQAEAPVDLELFSGTVTAVNNDQIAFDGPSLVTFSTEEGELRTIAIPSFGLNMCAAQANLADVFSLEAGDMIEVRGTVESDGNIVPCANEWHYLRVTSEVSSTPTTPKLSEGSTPPGEPALVKGHTWVWERTEMNDGTVTTPRQAGRYSVMFGNDGRLTGRTSCNGFGGEYQLGSDGVVSFGPFMSTLMYCEGSQENEFVKMVTESDRYLLTSDGKLVLNIKYDSGSVIFRKQ